MQALRRLMAEYKELTSNPVESIAAGPIDENNFFEWEAFIQSVSFAWWSRTPPFGRGPEGSPYENGLFRATLSFLRDYPLSPPTMRFTTPMYHPNSLPLLFCAKNVVSVCTLAVYPDGRVCISILHPPGDDPNGYEVVSLFQSLGSFSLLLVEF